MSVGGLVSVITFLGFSVVEMPVSGSGSGIPNQRLRVFVFFQLSTTWLRNKIFWHERQHCSRGNDVCKHNETLTVR